MQASGIGHATLPNRRAKRRTAARTRAPPTCRDGRTISPLACLLHKRENQRKASQAKHGSDDGKQLGWEARLVLWQLLPAARAGQRRWRGGLTARFQQRRQQQQRQQR